MLAKKELRIRFEFYFQMLRNKYLELVAQLDEVAYVLRNKWRRDKKAESAANCQS